MTNCPHGLLHFPDTSLQSLLLRFTSLGKVAMTIDGNYMMQNLQEIKDRLKDVRPINWDIVTVQVDL